MSKAGLLLMVLAFLAGAPAAEAAFPGENGKIAFTRFVTGSTSDLFVANPDGTDAQNLTSSNSTDDREPAWSGDGSKLAFWSVPFVYLIGADGSDPVLLRHGGEPSVSPDGSRIAYSTTGRFFPESNQEIFVMGSDGSSVRNLTSDPLGPEWPDDGAAAWSPDGTQIAFVRNAGAGGGIYVIAPDGTGMTQLVSGPARHPDWAPDGNGIVFEAFGDIFVVDASGLRRLTSSLADDRRPVFSPDGTLIAFHRFREGTGNTYDVMIMNEDGTDEHVGIANGLEPDWQPIPNRPPDCSAVRATPSSLGAPNHRLITVTISGATDPDGDPVELAITGVTQDEPVRGPADAVATTLPHRVRLRAERDPKGDGRVYRIAFEAGDGRGGTCTGFATASVRKGNQALDSAPPSYDSFGS